MMLSSKLSQLTGQCFLLFVREHSLISLKIVNGHSLVKSNKTISCLHFYNVPSN